MPTYRHSVPFYNPYRTLHVQLTAHPYPYPNPVSVFVPAHSVAPASPHCHVRLYTFLLPDTPRPGPSHHVFTARISPHAACRIVVFTFCIWTRCGSLMTGTWFCLPFLYSGVSYVHSSVLLQTLSPSPDCALIESVSLTGSGHIDMRVCAGQVAYVQLPDLGAQCVHEGVQ